MKTETLIAETRKGHRIYLESLATVGWHGGSLYRVDFDSDRILLTRATPDYTGKVRRVTASKNGVIDLESKRITTWANGSVAVTVEYGESQIIITRH